MSAPYTIWHLLERPSSCSTVCEQTWDKSSKRKFEKFDDALSSVCARAKSMRVELNEFREKNRNLAKVYGNGCVQEASERTQNQS